MAEDLDFSHNVSEIPAGASLPTLQKDIKPASGFDVPDLQGAVTNFAGSTNWMSSLGSAVASKASTAIATKIGGNLGKNPQGDLGIGVPITDFDKTMQESYKTQAQATLGLQADKLITDANIETAKASRITPELIANTNQKISNGLQSIFANAPAEIVPNLEKQYGALQLSQHAELTDRMFREQKQDRVNNTALSSQTNAEHAYSFGLRGNDKAALEAVENTKRLTAADVAAHLMTPVEAKSKVDTARQSYLSGKAVNGYEAARANNTSEQYLKDRADKKPSNISDVDNEAVNQNLMQYVGRQQAMRNQEETLSYTKFQTSIAMNPMAPDMPQQLQEFKQNVSAETYQKGQLDLVNAVKKFHKDTGDMYNAFASWNNSDSFSQLDAKTINKTFPVLTQRLMQQREQAGNPISQEDAEVQVAMSAGGKVPVFQKMMENKLLSGNPANIESAAHQMESLDTMKQGRVYAGVSQKAKAIGLQFQAQRGSMPDDELARKLTDNLSNIDDTVQKTLNNSWNHVLTQGHASGPNSNKSFAEFALQEVSLDKDKVGGPYFATIYGNDIYNQLNSNFMTTRGDYPTALKMTQDYVNQHYGETYVNGSYQKTDSPIEKFLGYEGNRDITPYIHQDMLNQLEPAFAESKKTTHGNLPEGQYEYWETLPLKNNVAEVKRTIYAKDGKKEYSYPVNLVGRAGNQWDVTVKTPYGPRNLFLVAPHVGVTMYQPNKAAIDTAYKNRKDTSYIGRA